MQDDKGLVDERFVQYDTVLYYHKHLRTTGMDYRGTVSRETVDPPQSLPECPSTRI